MSAVERERAGQVSQPAPVNQALGKCFRIARLYKWHTTGGMSSRSAMYEIAYQLGISVPAVCHAVTVAEDHMQDIRAANTL